VITGVVLVNTGIVFASGLNCPGRKNSPTPPIDPIGGALIPMLQGVAREALSIVQKCALQDPENAAVEAPNIFVAALLSGRLEVQFPAQTVPAHHHPQLGVSESRIELIDSLLREEEAHAEENLIWQVLDARHCSYFIVFPDPYILTSPSLP
jgi:hypothetical protein